MFKIPINFTYQRNTIIKSYQNTTGEASFPYQDEFGYGTKVLRNGAKTRGAF